MDTLSIVIVNWNTGDLLAACLRSLAQLPEKHLISHIFVVDNASTDNSLFQAQEQAKRDGSPVVFLPQTQNMGFAAANNLALSRLSDEEGQASHVLLLNPDTEVKPGAIQELLHALQRYPQAGVVGAKLVNSDGTVQPSVRQLPGRAVLMVWMLKATRFVRVLPFWRRYMQRDFPYDDDALVEQVMGAAFCIRRETLHQVGLLDENFWIWLEEVDYCNHVRQVGWQVYYIAGAVVVHHGSVSFSQLAGWQRSWPFVRSVLTYARKYFGFVFAAALTLLLPVTFFLSLPAGIVHRLHHTR